MGEGSGKSSENSIIKRENKDLPRASKLQELHACPNSKLEFKSFLNPCYIKVQLDPFLSLVILNSLLFPTENCFSCFSVNYYQLHCISKSCYFILHFVFFISTESLKYWDLTIHNFGGHSLNRWGSE